MTCGGLLVAPQFDSRSSDKGVTILTRAPRVCGTGNVHPGNGGIVGVLFINGPAGGANRTVRVPTGQSVEIAFDAAPAGSERGAYVA